MSNPYEHGGRGTKWSVEIHSATSHRIDCDWHCDQYPWECTCEARDKFALSAAPIPEPTK